MRHLHSILISLLLVVFASCGNNEEFLINCKIRGLGSKGVEMTYTTRGVQRVGFHPVDGKVTLRGVSDKPVLVEVSTIDNRLLFTCVAQNGDNLDVELDLDKPTSLKISGNDASEEYSRFIVDNDSLLQSDDVAGINRLIAAEVRRHPDRISSAMLLATRFQARDYELEADSLINTLKPDARPSGVMGAFASLVGEQVSSSVGSPVRAMTINCGYQNKQDTTMRYWASNQSYSMLVVTGYHRGDSIGKTLRELCDSLPDRRFKAFEIAVTGDSAMWKIAVRNDSTKWVKAWVPGGTASNEVRSLTVSSIPYFVVADSTGRQIYRGRSLSAANDTVRNRLESFWGTASSKKSDKDSPKAVDNKKPTAKPTPNLKPDTKAVKASPKLERPLKRPDAISGGQLKRADER